MESGKYKRILVPLDGSVESEMVLPAAQGLLAPDGEIILVRVVPEDTMIEETIEYLREAAAERIGSSSSWRCEVSVSGSVATGLLDTATREGADLIAMYSYGGEDLVELLQGSITENVQLWAPIEVKVFDPKELIR